MYILLLIYVLIAYIICNGYYIYLMIHDKSCEYSLLYNYLIQINDTVHDGY